VVLAARVALVVTALVGVVERLAVILAVQEVDNDPGRYG
jgi:hypothetical protein